LIYDAKTNVVAASRGRETRKYHCTEKEESPMNDTLGKIMVLLYAFLGLLCLASSTLDNHEKSAVVPRSELVAIDSMDLSPLAIVASESAALDLERQDAKKQSDDSKTTESASSSKNETDWSYFCLALALTVVAWSVCFVQTSRRSYLAAGFILSLLLFLVPYLGISSFGLVGLLGCTGFLIHFLAPRHLAEKSVFLGIGLAIFAYAFAIAGGLALHSDTASFERYSTAFYEATQLPLMNMSPHDHLKDTTAQFYFNCARVFGCLFAYFVAYKTVVYVCDRAKTQFLLGWYCVRNRKRLALVIGLGTVGRQLISNLIDENFRVIAIESDKDSVQIERAQSLGARVIVGDALDDRVYRRLPFDAVQSIYVVAGDDRKNLEIGQQLLEYSIKRVEKSDGRKSDKAPLWQRWFDWLTCQILLDQRAVCHVQLYDSNMQRLMEQERFCQAIERSHIEMRHFNAQQNAVRDLIQRELAKPDVRPQANKTEDVRLYCIVGFGDLGQEVALGLAQLAHFENLKRSRIVVFCADPKLESARFLAKYPKFTGSSSVYETLDNVQFDADLDSWEYKSSPQVELTAVPKDSSTTDRNADTTVNADPIASSETTSDAKYGVTFATNTIFVKVPTSPSDQAFMQSIFDLTKAIKKVSVKPSVIVCNEDASQSFSWSSEFVDAWRSFCQRRNLQPECPAGEAHPSLTTYFWLQGHKALQEVVKDNVRHIPFGLEENCIATKLLDATLLRQLGSVVEYSYKLSTSTVPVAADKSDMLTPMKFEFLKSNLHAAAHSLIKYQVAGRNIKPILAKTDVALPKIGTIDSFSMDGVFYTDPKSVHDDDRNQLLTISKMEHNRWMAEQLLKGYKYVATEQARVGNNRLPQYEHERATLCSWDQLSDAEKLKDLRQAYYVLYYLSTLESLQGESS